MEKEEKPTNPAPTDDSESLEATTTVVEGGSADASAAAGDTASAAGGATPGGDKDGKPKKVKKPNPVKGLAGKFNIYLLLFMLVILIAGMVTGLSILRSNKEDSKDPTKLTTEPLSQETLDKLRQTDVKVGDPKQILSVESNAIFAGKVLVRDSLEVAGEIKAGGALTLPGITVTGTALLNQVQASLLQVSGNTTIQGQLAVQNNLSVAGSGSFGGTLTAGKLNIQDLQISGDFQFTKHLDAGGGTPGLSGGGALGSGGTSSISGTDTAGTVAINTGGGPGAGCFANINFSQRFNGTPHVVVTPVGSAAGGLNFYINRSTSGFSICSTNAAPGGSSFAFDYIVID